MSVGVVVRAFAASLEQDLMASHLLAALVAQTKGIKFYDLIRVGLAEESAFSLSGGLTVSTT